MLRLIFLVLLTVVATGCPGPESSSNGDGTQGECTYNSDCGEGYECSSSGDCILSEDVEPTPPIDCLYSVPTAPVLYVATDGNDDSGDGSQSAPYATITHALDNIEDGGTILVKAGLYEGRVRIRGNFENGVTVRSQTAYMAKLRYDGTVITGYTNSNGCKGITIEGFDIAHTGPGSGPLVVHLDADGTGAVSRIALRNNILHDSYNNDILKINNGISDVIVERNLFFNQSGSDEHIDINSAANILVQDNIFMNDFVGSGRTDTGSTSSYIVIKDSNGEEDRYTGSHNVIVRRNIFLNWEGSEGSNFLLLGEDGQNFYEAYDITIENNLMLGNSGNVMRAPFGIKGGSGVTFINNTIAGDLPSVAFAMRFNREGENPVNEDIELYNNIWSDPTGTMGSDDSGSSNTFSDTPSGDVDDFVLNNNLYWNGGGVIPEDSSQVINVSDDTAAIILLPDLGLQDSLVPPHWDSSTQVFADGSSTICEAFINLAETYGTPGDISGAIGLANTDHLPHDDLLGNERGDSPDIGAVELQ